MGNNTSNQTIKPFFFYFFKKCTISHVKSCIIDLQARKRLFLMHKYSYVQIDIQVTKYLIDSYCDQIYDWNEIIYTYGQEGFKPAHFICEYFSKDMVLYFLNICDEKNLDLNCETLRGSKPVDFICAHGDSALTNRMLDICIGKNYDLEGAGVGLFKLKPIHSIFGGNDSQLINRILDIYTEKNLDLELEAKRGIRPIHMLFFKHIDASTANRVLDIYIEKKFDLECEIYTRKIRPIHLICRYNPHLINRILDIYIENNLDLKCEDVKGFAPIHYICKFGFDDTIDRILNIYVQKYGHESLLPLVFGLHIPMWKYMSLKNRMIKYQYVDTHESSEFDFPLIL